ncbi:MAG: superoxide dismutase [Deltaproteobacteria bacterium]|nr:superoxide dismutase [Deltaproteobacteria bacterium]
MSHRLPDLPYDFGALEPHIDARTMEVHHGKHHKAYVDKLNAALESGGPQWQDKPVEALLKEIGAVPEGIRTAVRNHGGGHANHALFWQIMSKHGGGEPGGPLADAIKATWGDFPHFQKFFADTATNRFGSGWAWLVVASGKKLECYSTANQDSPWMDGKVPLLGLDVWEHAYYLKYQSRRPEYITAWWHVVNWQKVGELYAQAAK